MRSAHRALRRAGRAVAAGMAHTESYAIRGGRGENRIDRRGSGDLAGQRGQRTARKRKNTAKCRRPPPLRQRTVRSVGARSATDAHCGSVHPGSRADALSQVPRLLRPNRWKRPLWWRTRKSGGTIGGTVSAIGSGAPRTPWGPRAVTHRWSRKTSSNCCAEPRQLGHEADVGSTGAHDVRGCFGASRGFC